MTQKRKRELFSSRKLLIKLAPQVRLELTTLRLTAECSAIELLRNIWHVSVEETNLKIRNFGESCQVSAVCNVLRTTSRVLLYIIASLREMIFCEVANTQERPCIPIGNRLKIAKN